MAAKWGGNAAVVSSFAPTPILLPAGKQPQPPHSQEDTDNASPESVPSTSDPAILGSDDNLRLLMIKEEDYLPSMDYFKLLQPEVKPGMRKTVTRWMAEVCSDEQCDPDVMFLAVNCLDRFLSLEGIHCKQLQLLACACMFAASKLRQATPLSAKHLIRSTDYSISVSELVGWELLLLGKLKWNLAAVTPHDVLDQLFYRLRLPNPLAQQVRGFAVDFVAMICSEYHLAVLQPSTIACGCLSAALHGLLGMQEDVFPTILGILQSVVDVDEDILRQQMQLIHNYLIEEICRKTTKTSPESLLAGSFSFPVTSKEPFSDPTLTPTDILEVEM